MTPSAEILDALPVAVYTTDAHGRITYYNQAAEDLWGHRPKIGSDQWCGSWRLFWPDGRLLPHDECPMAVTLKEGHPVRGVEAIAERPDGTRVPFLPYPTPLRDATGQLVGAINLLVDLTERRRAEVESAQLAAIVASSDDAIISKTLEGRVTSWNEGASRIFGWEASEMIGQPILRIIPPELHDEEVEILARLRRGERIEHFDTVRLAKDGRRVDISLVVSPIRDSSGRVTGASKVARDVTERKEAEKLQRLLVDELNHRVKNTLATVQAIASHSLRRARNSEDFVSSFTGRVQALARAHHLLTERTWRGADVADLVREQVVLGVVESNRVAFSGPALLLDPQSALHLALVLHELATNARKYGALSVPQGQLSVSWSMLANKGRMLVLRWSERGGPAVAAPSSVGFGTSLIQQALDAHGGSASIQYAAEGVTCEIKLPLAEPVPLGSAASEAAAVRAQSIAVLQPTDKPSLRGKRILVVEDEALLSMDLEASLAAAGCHVVGPAATVETARKLITHEQCDAALLDVNLSGHPVDELAAALTKHAVPFAFLTGYGREALPRGFGEAKMLGKPFSQHEVLAMLAQLLTPRTNVVSLRHKTL
ncbi:MAG: PAS domain S-box protein [Xanthobacteraceae bacterium]